MGMYIVCTGTSGRAVVLGDADSEPEVGGPFRLTDSRMVLYWSGECGGLLGLAAMGPKTTTRLTHTVMATSSAVAHQVIPVSEEVAELIRAWPAWVGE